MQETKVILLLSMQNEKQQMLQYDYVSQIDQLLDYDSIVKKVLQKYKYVASGKDKIRLNINNFYKHQIKVTIPIFHPKNWATIIENMLERSVFTINVSVTKLGQLRIRKQREKQVPVQFDSDGSIESVEDDVIKQAILVNRPSNPPYRGQAVVRCFFCNQSNKSKQGSRSAGLFYGPFKNKSFGHMLCLLWCSDVFIENQTFNLCGVDKAIQNSKKLTCKYCKQKGASSYCHTQSCRKAAHFKCAFENGWYLDWQNYQAYCPDERIVLCQPQQIIVESNTVTATNRRERTSQVKKEQQKKDQHTKEQQKQ